VNTYYTNQLTAVLNDAKQNDSLINFKFSSGCNVKTKTLNLNSESVDALKDFLYDFTPEIENADYRLANIRLTGIDKNYYAGQLQQFANSMSVKFKDFKLVEFGRQDIRGGHSICIYNTRNCVNHQKFFNSKNELLGFVCGFNSSNSNQEYL